VWIESAEVDKELQIKRDGFQSNVTDIVVNNIVNKRTVLHGHEEETLNLRL
jgi:hypothetical protein